MKIKVKEIVKGCMPIRSGEGKSDCFDLFLAEDVTLKKGEMVVASLGVAMECPKGFGARIFLRSSSPVKHNVFMANHIGIIDHVFKGDDDIWKCELVALKATTIPKFTRICQFEIISTQFATVGQKIKWLFSSKPKLIKVESLNNNSRGGIGTTGN